MVDLISLTQAAKITKDEQGNPIVQIPLEVWEEWLSQNLSTQNARMVALLDEWDANPDDTPAEWWDEFREFLKENRFNLS